MCRSHSYIFLWLGSFSPIHTHVHFRTDWISLFIVKGELGDPMYSLYIGAWSQPP